MTTKQLDAAGWSERRRSSAVSDGRLIAVRRGHFARPDAHPELVRAVRLGGLATGTTATRALGIWTPPDPPLEVAVPQNAPRLRDPDDGSLGLHGRDDVCLHWSTRISELDKGTGAVPLLLALEHLLQCVLPEHAVAVLDSALHLRHVGTRDLAVLKGVLPHHSAALVDAVDGRCESGIESIARFLLQQLGLHVEVQRSLRGVGRVDLLIAGYLIVELDGREWHDGFDAFERDRHRDAAAWQTGRRPTLRFTYRQVLFEWPSVQAAILAALAV